MDFIEVARFATRLEAETIGHALDQYEIPFMVRVDDAGGVHVDFSHAGAALLVPADQRELVARLLNCVVRPSPGEGADAEA